MEADRYKIGNARQQNDNLIAVQGAIRLGLCWENAVAYLKTQESPVDYGSYQMAFHQAYVADNTGPQADAWIKSAIMEKKAADMLQQAIANGLLPIWRIHDAREVQVAPISLDAENIKYGILQDLHPPRARHARCKAVG